MESDEEEEEELDRDGSDVLASIISTAVKSDGFFRHQQVQVLFKSTFKKAEFLQHTHGWCERGTEPAKKDHPWT